MARDLILKALARLGACVEWEGPIEVLLIGGAAGIITGQLSSDRTTGDCDVISYSPPEAMQAAETAATQVAGELGLPLGWLSSEARQLDILPDGWRRRRRHAGTFGKLCVYAIGRRDLLATKFYANRPEDREDIRAMQPTAAELRFVRTYLTMLRVPSRQANLDQVDAATKTLAAFEVGLGHA